MKSYETFFLLLFFRYTLGYSQEKYVERHPNGNLKIDGYVVEKTLDSIYKEYYENGNIKEEGFFKNCEYETNAVKIHTIPSRFGKSHDTAQHGKRHGTWKSYHENGNLESSINYHCNFLQGNFYSYDRSGNLESLKFYSEGNLISSIEYYESGFIKKNSFLHIRP